MKQGKFSGPSPRGRTKRHRLYDALLFVIGFFYLFIGVAVTFAVLLCGWGADRNMWLLYLYIITSFGLSPVLFGVIPLGAAIARVVHVAKEKKVLAAGSEAEAEIVGCKVLGLPGERCERFSLTLACMQSGNSATFTTAARFDRRQFNYLLCLGRIHIRIFEKSAAVAEPFPEDLYTDPKWGAAPPARPNRAMTDAPLRRAPCARRSTSFCSFS